MKLMRYRLLRDVIHTLLTAVSLEFVSKLIHYCYFCLITLLRCGPVLEMVLRMLFCYLAANKNYFQRISTLQTPETAESEREELVRALVAAQESTAIQILFEVCLPCDGEVRLKLRFVDCYNDNRFAIVCESYMPAVCGL